MPKLRRYRATTPATIRKRRKLERQEQNEGFCFKFNRNFVKNIFSLAFGVQFMLTFVPPPLPGNGKEKEKMVWVSFVGGALQDMPQKFFFLL